MTAFAHKGLPAITGLCLLAAGGLQATGATGTPLAALLLAGAFGCAALVVRHTRWGIFASAAYALAANAYLFSRKFESAQQTDAICNVSDVINCDVINSSAQSEMFGVPITLLGAGFYLGLAVASFLAKDEDPRFYQVTSLFSVANVIYSLYLAGVAAQIGAVCMLCISIYAANGILLWAGLKGMGATGTSLFDTVGAATGSTSFLAITLVFGGTVLIGGSSWQTEQARLHNSTTLDTNRKPLPTAELTRVFHAPGGPIKLDGTEPVLGDPDAPYMLVEWADYGCPHCARAAAELKRLISENPEIQLRFKVFPLDGICNPALSPNDGKRCEAAKAAECANQQGSFWKMQDLLFKNQGYFAPDELRHMAGQAGLDVNAWQACMSDPATNEAVVADATAGDKARIFGTPALFLQGTHGSQFVETEGITGALRLIEAHSAGMNLPEPPPWKPPPGME